MKYGIVTFHSVINYGSALQAYAMQEGIAKCGVDTELIDYRPEMHVVSVTERIKNNWKRLLSVQKWKRFIGQKLFAKKTYYVDEERSKRRKIKFQEFQNENFRLSPLAQNKDELKTVEEYYDACVCGSDQVWNPTYIGHDMGYFLNFVSDDYKRIAYAPSIAVSVFPNEYRAEIEEQMKKFDRISVREKESVKVVEKLTGQSPTVVVDPTLLLEQSDWEKIERKPNENYMSEPYIFCYFLGPNSAYCDYVNRLKELTGLRVVVVTCTELKVFQHFGDITCDDIGPAEFVYLIHHAAYVCTDSFHGTVFSIINERKFFTFKRYSDKSISSENSRVYTLLDMIGHPERLIDDERQIENQYLIMPDYREIKQRIATCREASVQYLRDEIQRVSTRAEVMQ